TLQSFFLKEREEKIKSSLNKNLFKKFKILKLSKPRFLIETKKFKIIPISFQIEFKKGTVEIIIENKIKRSMEKIINFKIKKSS
ncbi:hypothetical protein, partial [Mycoplasma procyoni]|uniref:hypothetical protein n=1 Tax=Mycoplasma procyoni TaxID=568784 RepID=UPI00197C47B5